MKLLGCPSWAGPAVLTLALWFPAWAPGESGAPAEGAPAAVEVSAVAADRSAAPRPAAPPREPSSPAKGTTSTAETDQPAFYAPLSFEDALRLIESVLNDLPKGEDGDAADPARLRDMAESAHLYLQYQHDLHSSLSDYTWIYLDDEPVENDPGLTDRDTVRLDPPVEMIGAIGLEARGGDVQVHRLTVFDENDEFRDEWSRPIPWMLRSRLPRFQIFQIWRRTTVGRIEIEYSRANQEERPRVVFNGGRNVDGRPERIKTAMERLEMATRLLDREPVRWETVGSHLTLASEEIRQFMEEERSRR